MKYCLKYRHTSHFNRECDELMIDYHYRKENNIINFLQAHEQQRIIFNIVTFAEVQDHLQETLEFFVAIKQEFPNINFTLKFNIPNVLHDDVRLILAKLKALNIPYFFGLKITDWDILHLLLQLDVSDVYISEAMGFELFKIAPVVHARGVQIRVFPNVAQSSNESIAAPIKFFIRPEDTSLYEPYVDVFELFGEDSRLDAYFKIYAIHKKWLGNLNDLIIFNSYDKHQMAYDNRYIAPGFAVRRIQCGKKCLKGTPCNSCYRHLQHATLTTEHISKTKNHN